MGADAVSVHINIGSPTESNQLKTLSDVAKSSAEWGMPLLAMMYPRGPAIKNPHDPEVVALAARAGAELGADLIKTNYTGDPDTFKTVVRGCPVPVIIAGGPKMKSDRDVLETVEGAMGAGAKGVAIGRNVFQHESPTKITRAIARIVHEGWPAADALGELK
jgi:fructose-bisphosphate aldolase/2-amino-3,7-dideoxy-D-threo-hept-6-ulosonate synthase